MTGRSTKVVLSALATAALAACSATAPPPAAKPRARPPVAPASPLPARKAAVLEGTFWKPVEAKISAVVRAPDPPLRNEQFARAPQAEARWTAAPEALRERVRKNGFAVLAGPPTRTRLGDYYVELQAARVPFVVTMDAMLQIAHIAIDQMLAEAEERAMAPALSALLARVDARLAAESKKTPTDLDLAYDAARGLVAVARELLDATYVPPPDLSSTVAEEVRRVRAHAGVAESALLGIPLDYAQMAPRGGLAKGDPSLGAYLALAWLAQAPLMVASRAEAIGAPLDVYEARTQTRAALLLGRLLSPEVDAGAAAAWDRIARPLALSAGPSDDLTPRDVVAFAKKAGLDARESSAIQNVARVDKARHACIDARPQRLYDGVRGVQMRLFGSAAAPDAEALQMLVAPAVPGRAMPAGLDVASCFGSAEARAVAREADYEGWRTYDVALDALVQRRPPAEERHGSLVASGLEALGAYLAPSAADGAVPASTTSAWRRRKIEVALGGWTTIRHDAIALSRLRPAQAPAETAFAGARALGFVEPHPEAIAELVALVEQASRGLVAIGALPDAPSPTSVAGEATAVLRACLAIALRQANDEALGADDASRLAELPARIQDLESRAGAVASQRPLVTDVHVDLGASRVLLEATGAIDDLYVVLREPANGRLVLAIGASIAHYEYTQPAALRLTDHEWRARLRAGPPPRAAWTSAYVVSATDKSD